MVQACHWFSVLHLHLVELDHDQGAKGSSTSSYESSSPSASSSKYHRLLLSLLVGLEAPATWRVLLPPKYRRAHSNDRSRTETFTPTPSTSTCTQFTISLPLPYPTHSLSASCPPSEDFEIIWEGSEDFPHCRTEFGSGWTSIDRSSSFASSASCSCGSETLCTFRGVVHRICFLWRAASFSNTTLRRQHEDSFGHGDRLSVPSTPPHQRSLTER